MNTPDKSDCERRPRATSRPRYRLHPVTRVVVIAFGAALGYAQFIHVWWAYHGGHFDYACGWPRPYLVWFSHEPLRTQFYFHGLAVNAATWLALVATASIPWERWARRRFRLSLVHLFVLLTPAGVFLCQLPWTGDLPPGLQTIGFWFARVSLRLAVASAVVLGTWLVCDAIGCAVRLIRRRPTLVDRGDAE